ncbi:MAG TPA: hypothetical protein PKY38_08910 [Opitutaceae bacterium]|nr:hypothetical protein [Opitutaceae bacterium]
MTPTASTALRNQRVRHIAQRALRGYGELSAAEKIELLLSIAEIYEPLGGPEAEAARSTAWTLQMAEQQQLKFRELLTD